MNVIGFKKARCKNCYKCVRVCELKAITFQNDQAQILNDRCILCGECLDACPQNAKTYISDLELVKGFIKNKIPTVISIAPSYLAAFQSQNPAQIIAGLKRLGFSAVRETAEGAAHVTREYIKLLERGEMKNIITTCCPSANDLAEIYYPSLIEQLAPVLSPMIAHGKLIKEIYGEKVKTVFLGPCIAKKREAATVLEKNSSIDAVLTFQEIEEWFNSESINLLELDPVLPDNENPMVNRLYPVSGGILTSVISTENIAQDKYDKFYVDGMENCIKLFESLKKGEIENSFIEVNLCSGGCVGGPRMGCTSPSKFKSKLIIEKETDWQPADNLIPFKDEKTVGMSRTFRDRHLSKDLPEEKVLRKLLEETGKKSREDELDCGACGYSSCREKAVAVYQGMAEISMCMPYMQEKAQSMANVVMENTPNILVIADADLKIVESSKTAEKYFKISQNRREEKYLFEFLDPKDFNYVLSSKESIRNKKIDIPHLSLTMLQTIVYIEEIDGVLGIFQDITQEEKKLRQAYRLKMDTVEMAQKVIDNQMLVAQEIAGLLGETTAETKVTLTKLRDLIFYDGES